MATTKAKGNRKNSSGNSEFNALSFLIENILKGRLNTALPVKVVGVATTGTGATGYVDVVPLIQMYDGYDNAIASTTIYKVPYTRIQGGVAALVIDPVVGDTGIAVFAQQDITGVNSEPQKPLTKRTFSMADAIYLGGILNGAPSIYIELTQDGVCNITAPNTVQITTGSAIVNCDTTTVNAASKVVLSTPLTEITGQLTTGTESGGGAITMTGDVTINGTLTANGVSLTTHTHSGVQTGSGNTGAPNV